MEEIKISVCHRCKRNENVSVITKNNQINNILDRHCTLRRVFYKMMKKYNFSLKYFISVCAMDGADRLP